MPQIMPLPTLMLVHTWYRKSTPRSYIYDINWYNVSWTKEISSCPPRKSKSNT